MGPDLTGVGRRFNAKDLLESMINPNKVISDQYQSTIFILDNGKTVTGRVVNLKGNELRVMTDMLNPGEKISVKRNQVEEMLPSPTSMMPTGVKITGLYTTSILAKTEAVTAGYDEAVLLNWDGTVSEGSGENLFMVSDGRISTPSETDNCLLGITRDSVILFWAQS